MRHSSTTALVIALIVLCTVSIDVTWKYFLEKSARTQAVFALNNVKQCVNTILLRDNDENIVDYRTISNTEVEKAIRTCGAKSLITPTGDIFAFDLRSKDFIFDPSLDCYVEGGKKMTVESLCPMHKDQKACEEIIEYTRVGYDSDTGLNAWWQFDTSKEYLEWVVLPSETTGYDGLIRGGPLIPHQVMLVQGIQEDELQARYTGFRITLYLIGFISIILNLLLSVRHNIGVTGRKKDDK